jgi:hypothetical protein
MSPLNRSVSQRDYMDKSEQRIHSVLGDDNERTPRNARRYLVHLKKHLSLPLRVTGIEDFLWEEPYVFGYRDRNRYEEMKKTNPSYTDEFDLIDILDPEFDDLIAKIRRVSDGKTFQMGLSWLRCVDKKSPDYVTLNDYSVWYVNY